MLTSPLGQMEDSSSPAAATTAEEAMVSTGEGEAPAPGLSVDGSSQCSSGPRAGHDEVAPEMEPWAAAVPPVRMRFCSVFVFLQFMLMLFLHRSLTNLRNGTTVLSNKTYKTYLCP